MLEQGKQTMWTGTIISNELFGKDCGLMRLYCPQVAGKALPGQFANIKTVGEAEPYLRRPLTFFRVQPQDGWIEFVYKIKGKGTLRLTHCRKGDTLDLLAPLGKGYSVSGKAPILVVGRGIGAASLVYLAEQQAAQGVPVYALISFSEEQAIYGEYVLQNCCRDVRFVTDSSGSSQLENVQAILKTWLSAESFGCAYTCGSKRLAVLLRDLLQPHHIRAEISLEERMGCGFGACLVCTCDTKHGDKTQRVRVCSEGPVFALEDVMFDG